MLKASSGIWDFSCSGRMMKSLIDAMGEALSATKRLPSLFTMMAWSQLCVPMKSKPWQTPTSSEAALLQWQPHSTEPKPRSLAPISLIILMPSPVLYGEPQG